MAHEDCQGKLLEAEFHMEDKNKLIFLMSEDGIRLKIVEADMMHNTAETVSVIECDTMKGLRIAEDLSTIYLIRGMDTYNSYNYVLDCIQYGSDFDAIANKNNYVKNLGIWIEKTAIINNSLIVYSETYGGSLLISMFDGENEIVSLEPNFDDTEISSFSYIEETKEFL